MQDLFKRRVSESVKKQKEEHIDIWIHFLGTFYMWEILWMPNLPQGFLGRPSNPSHMVMNLWCKQDAQGHKVMTFLVAQGWSYGLYKALLMVLKSWYDHGWRDWVEQNSEDMFNLKNQIYDFTSPCIHVEVPKISEKDRVRRKKTGAEKTGF